MKWRFFMLLSIFHISMILLSSKIVFYVKWKSWKQCAMDDWMMISISNILDVRIDIRCVYECKVKKKDIFFSLFFILFFVVAVDENGKDPVNRKKKDILVRWLNFKYRFRFLSLLLLLLLLLLDHFYSGCKCVLFLFHF